MDADKLYELGYEDGKAGKSANASYIFDENYSMGYEDGKGDRAANRAVDPDFANLNAPPDGFEYIGEKRVPNAFEWYLSKAGNPTFLDRPRRNNQTRHILRATHCVCGKAKVCGFHD